MAHALTHGEAVGAGDDFLDTLERIQRRVLWLAVRMVDHANRERPNRDGVKVGGHQASSASMVSLMTALWFAHLNPEDRVSVKPHASPVLHAIHYLLGELDGRYLTTLRERGGLQAYPSRTKDPDRVDFSTGSVAPLFAALTRRYVDAHFGPRPRSRFIALMGDAELDEGNVWEALADPATQGLGEALCVVDLNRQSLDRVIPGVKADTLKRLFETNGWHVLDVKYGRLLQEAFSPDVSVSTNLGGWINKMGVFAPEDRPDWTPPERLLRWRETPAGHHIELGASRAAFDDGRDHHADRGEQRAAPARRAAHPARTGADEGNERRMSDPVARSAASTVASLFAAQARIYPDRVAGGTARRSSPTARSTNASAGWAAPWPGGVSAGGRRSPSCPRTDRSTWRSAWRPPASVPSSPARTDGSPRPSWPAASRRIRTGPKTAPDQRRYSERVTRIELAFSAWEADVSGYRRTPTD